jgi:hypothetical protein
MWLVTEAFEWVCSGCRLEAWNFFVAFGMLCGRGGAFSLSLKMGKISLK